MRELNSLSSVCYYDSGKEIMLNCYADTLVYRKEGNSRTLVAIRFGGYPEHVRGMSDAINGGIKLEAIVGDKTIYLTTMHKQYRKAFSHDGIYAEAMLTANDDSLEDTDDDEQTKCTDSAKRKAFIFCEAGNKTALFEEIDKKTTVPLISEFRDYVLCELEKQKILIPLDVLSASKSFDAYMLEIYHDEREVIEIVNKGLSSKQIEIPNANYGLGGSFNDVNGVSQYLKEFGITIANRIKSLFTPIFDPSCESICDKLKRINGCLYKKVGYSLYPAQLAVAESVKRRLDKSKTALVIAECGSGKTKIGACALAAHQKNKSFNVILCPSHVAKKWVREIGETLPNTNAAVIHSIAELNNVYQYYLKGSKTTYVVISKERARDGYMHKPAVRWSKSKRAFVCPDCGKIIEMKVIDDGCAYMVNANQFFFLKENDKNHKCEHCGSVLWTVLNPNCLASAKEEWIKIGGYGYVHRYSAHQHLESDRKKDKSAITLISKIANNPDGVYPAVGAYRRYSLSSYIKEKIQKVNGLILDELHQYKGDSGQGAAMAELIGVSDKVIGMTATLINGYSSGIFYLLFRISPNLMLTDGKEYDNPTVFNAEYGVTESIYEIDEAEYNANCRNKKRKVRERQLPGVSPLVYSRFLIESAAFLSLNDMGKQLPDYEEIPIKLEMNADVKGEYERLERELTSIIKSDKKIARKILSRYLGLLSTYPDQPYAQDPIYYPGTKTELVTPMDKSNIDELHEKDLAVLDIVERKVKNGERVLLYTNWVKIDTQAKLAKILTEKGYRVDTLTVKVAPDKREEWVDKKVKSGIDVLITNPSLVETGLDLNAFTTLIYYNIGYNLFTFRQSSRRSWRINQTAPKIEVYILYYEGTMQARAIKLMASKLAVATIIEGNLSDEGLAAMSDCRDMTTLLAKELTLGIKAEVEDVAEAFKKMAVINSDKADAIVIDDYMILPDEPIKQEIKHVIPIVEASLADIRVKVAQTIDYAVMQTTKPKLKKSSEPDPNQLNLFDLIAS